MRILEIEKVQAADVVRQRCTHDVARVVERKAVKRVGRVGVREIDAGDRYLVLGRSAWIGVARDVRVGEERDRLDTLAEVSPELLDVFRAGEAAGQTDDGNRLDGQRVL